MKDIRPIFAAIGTALRRAKQTAEARWNEILFDRDYRQRCIDGTRWMGSIAVVLVGLSASACVPRQVSRAITAEHRRCSEALNAAAEVSVEAFDAEVARCHANIDRIQP